MIQFLIKIHTWLFPYKLSENHDAAVAGRRRLANRKATIKLFDEYQDLFIKEVNYPCAESDSPWVRRYDLIDKVNRVVTADFKPRYPKENYDASN